MSFCAIFDPASPRLELLRRLAGALSGTGDPVYWAEGPVALAHRRAAPGEAVLQPFLGDARLACALFSGHLEEGDALAAELARAGCLRAERPGPLDILVASFERWVEEFPRHLAGDWAALLWDRKKRRLLGARGGEGDLSIARAESVVAVATDASALALLPGAGDAQLLPERHLLEVGVGGVTVRPA